MEHVAASRHPVSRQRIPLIGACITISTLLSLSLSISPLFHPSRSPTPISETTRQPFPLREWRTGWKMSRDASLDAKSCGVVAFSYRSTPSPDGARATSSANGSWNFLFKRPFAQPMRILELVFPHLRIADSRIEGYNIYGGLTSFRLFLLLCRAKWIFFFFTFLRGLFFIRCLMKFCYFRLIELSEWKLGRQFVSFVKRHNFGYPIVFIEVIF